MTRRSVEVPIYAVKSPISAIDRLRERERNSWLEKHERTRKWFAVADAAEAVEEPELREAILKFENVRHGGA
jgi:hypothetical protein